MSSFKIKKCRKNHLSHIKFTSSQVAVAFADGDHLTVKDVGTNASAGFYMSVPTILKPALSNLLRNKFHFPLKRNPPVWITLKGIDDRFVFNISFYGQNCNVDKVHSPQ